MFLRSVVASLRYIALWRKRGDIHPDRVQRLAIVELTRLGDLISILSSVGVLAREFPSSSIHLFVDRHFVALLQGMDLPVTVVGVDRSLTVSGLLSGLKAIRALNPDMALSMSPANRNAFLVLASGARYKAGYLRFAGRMSPGRPAMPVETAGCPEFSEKRGGPESITERASRVCRSIGVEREPTQNLKLLPEVAEPASRRLKGRDRIPPGEYIVIHPFSRWRYRSWEAAKFVVLTKSLLARFGNDVVFLGEADEGEGLEWFRQQLGPDGRVRFFASEDLLESAVLINGASLFIGNDSGPLHLAAALGVKVIGLFGPAPPALTGPRMKEGVFLYKKLECSPCDQRRCVRPEDACLAKISPEEVLGAVAHLVEQGRPMSRRVHA